jgi:arylformamidase
VIEGVTLTIYDITLGISPVLPVWPGDQAIVLEQVKSMDDGAHSNVTRLGMSAHTGTHVDAPHHFLNDHRTVEQLSLEILTGKCFVLNLSSVAGHITADVLRSANIPEGTLRLLIKTKNSARWQAGEKEFFAGFQGISEDGARWLVEKGIKLIGIDYLSVAPYKQSVPTHTVLLKAGVIALEGVDLSAVNQGEYDLYCLPLKLIGSDGAPARVILIS